MISVLICRDKVFRPYTEFVLKSNIQQAFLIKEKFLKIEKCYQLEMIHVAGEGIEVRTNQFEQSFENCKVVEGM